MSFKLECPVCHTYTSAVMDAFSTDNQCPHCGISAAAMQEVWAANRRSTEGANEQLRVAIVKADYAVTELARIRQKIAEIQQIIGEIIGECDGV